MAKNINNVIMAYVFFLFLCSLQNLKTENQQDQLIPKREQANE
jgi:hypothetical protein